jgi:hypothetical protein
MYLQTTSTRRADMVTAWEANEMLGTGVRGMLVHIAQDPHAVVTRMRPGQLNAAGSGGARWRWPGVHVSLHCGCTP